MRNNKPDILFLNIVLDAGSGFDILDAIDYDEIHVVMCSAHDEFALKAIRYQVTDYLLKPLEIQDLISTVEKIQKRIKKHKERQESASESAASPKKRKKHVGCVM